MTRAATLGDGAPTLGLGNVELGVALTPVKPRPGRQPGTKTSRQWLSP
jgi:hypothetical protein